MTIIFYDNDTETNHQNNQCKYFYLTGMLMMECEVG